MRPQIYIWDTTYLSYLYEQSVVPISWRNKSNGELYSQEEYNKYPVALVNYNDAIAYCKWLSDKEGKIYRLPTEAEWEYVANGGKSEDSYIFSGSNIENTVSCNSTDSKRFFPCKIGTKKPNSLGIYDLNGNVQEWCLDWIHINNLKLMPNYPIKINYSNPVGMDSTSNHKVVRGGSFISSLPVWITSRDYQDINEVNIYTGFRVVREAN